MGPAEIDYSCATVPGRLEIAGSRRTKVTVRATRVGVGTVPYHASKRRVWVGRVKGQQHERTTGATAGERSTTCSSHGALGDRTMRSIWLVLSRHRPPYRHTFFQVGMCYFTCEPQRFLRPVNAIRGRSAYIIKIMANDRWTESDNRTCLSRPTRLCEFAD